MRIIWSLTLTLWISHQCFGSGFQKSSFNRHELHHCRQEAQSLFYHAYDNYLRLAYPDDELYPIRCRGRTRNVENDADLDRNDVMGNYSATLVDSLTTLAIMGDKDRFKKAIDLIRTDLEPEFKINATVQVFETTIRILGGLLSAHLYATDPAKRVFLGREYDGILLHRAHRLADRLLPAYLTKTGLPLPRINLATEYRNVPPGFLQENNAAAMASPMLEFTLLSYLTHDDKYRQVTKYAFDKIWSLRSEIDLVPMSFSPHTEMANNFYTGIGASIDSFYEYALKGAILFQDDELWNVWELSYNALRKHSRGDWFFSNVELMSGHEILPWIDSLSAFFPGLQVLAGDVPDAQKKHLMFLKLWNTYGGIPERWEFDPREFENNEQELNASYVPLPWYPLRPEFVETTYFLYRATRDAFYLQVARSILQDLKNYFMTDCGFAGLQDVMTGQFQDRMETFVLSETLKYLYLTFDVDNELHKDGSNVIFSTEAHPLWLKAADFKRYKSSSFFEDTRYRDHLLRVQQRDASLKSSNINRFFHDISNLLLYRARYPDRNSTLNRKGISTGTCPIMRSANDSFQFLHSDVIRHCERLFEIDYRYASNLRKPSKLIDRVPIELESSFYHIWGSQTSPLPKCQLPPTTDSFDVIFRVGWSNSKTPPNSQLSGVYGPIKDSITIESLIGVRLQVEALIPGAIDLHGEVVDADYLAYLWELNSPAALGFPNPGQDFKNSASNDPRRPIYRVSILNGIQLAHNATVWINSTLDTSPSALGMNHNGMLMLDKVPVVNALFKSMF
ncbi:LADA_0A08438g1_1 [Lachancea dasiensis]|uniref:alpha-1,2-Mannosidase n=1 Tax=Lachancea dasiensis TaxID=1072105 RepID=A0A1G4IQW7_9SACH|nr:LADA_0A08438g1_1 [Lachancea dasiensis]